MYTKRIIPCLDVNNGRVVKGVNFVILRMPEIRLRLQKHMIKQVQMNLYFLILQHHQMKRNSVDMVRRWQKMYLFHLLLAEESVQ